MSSNKIYRCCCYVLRTSLTSTNLWSIIMVQLKTLVCGYVLHILYKYYFDILLLLLFKTLISYRHSVNGMSCYMYYNSEEIYVYHIHSSHLLLIII